MNVLYLLLYGLAFILFIIAGIIQRGLAERRWAAWTCLTLGLAAWVLVSLIYQARHLSAGRG